MCNGKIVYQDSSKAMLPYFKKQGFQHEENDNPADFVLDVLIDISRMAQPLQELHEAYLQSPMQRRANDLLATYRANMNNSRHMQKDVDKRSRARELIYVSWRTCQNTIRDPALFLSQVVVGILLGLMIGLVFYNLEREINKGVGNRLGAIFIIVVSHIVSSLTALQSLIEDRALFIHVSLSIDIENINKIVCILGKYKWLL